MANGWTTYGKRQMCKAGLGAIVRPTLYVALFSGTADPSATPAELTLAGYGRSQVGWIALDDDNYVNSSDVYIGPMAAGSYTGLAIFDDAIAGAAWVWQDEPTPVTIPASSNLLFSAGALKITRV